MADRNWDDDDFELPSGEPSYKNSTDDRWEGEDEEKVKDNWDDEDDEESKPAPVTNVPKKKSKKQIIAEKQAEKERILAAKRAEIARLNAEMTPEEKLAEKQRLQKLQEESDLQFAVDMMGIKDAPAAELSSLADVDLSTATGLDSLATTVISKIRTTDRLEKRTFYPIFCEKFCKDLCFNLEVDELKKVIAALNALANEKVKANKPQKGKKKSKPSAKLHLGREEELAEDDRYIDDLDDFI